MSLQLAGRCNPIGIAGGILRIASFMDKAGGAIRTLSFIPTYDDEWNSWSVQILKEICRSV